MRIIKYSDYQFIAISQNAILGCECVLGSKIRVDSYDIHFVFSPEIQMEQRDQYVYSEYLRFMRWLSHPEEGNEFIFNRRIKQISVPSVPSVATAAASPASGK